MEKRLNSNAALHSYFLLQLRMAGRKLSEFGVHPILGVFLFFAGVILFSLLLFTKTELAPFIIVLIVISFIIPLGDLERCNFLKSCFDDTIYYLIRILENVFISLPFLIILSLKSAYLPALILLVMAVLLGLTRQGAIVSRSIPTPFGSRPFEFLVGFRKTIFVFPIIVFLIIMAIIVDNFNLGIFSILLIYVLSLTYYGTPEKLFYVWMNSNTPKNFLKEKVRSGIIHSFILSLPLAITLILFYPSNFLYIGLTLITGTLFLVTMILAKYSSYPQEINLPQGILFGICIFFPPAIIIVIPILYRQSIKRLSEILI